MPLKKKTKAVKEAPAKKTSKKDVQEPTLADLFAVIEELKKLQAQTLKVLKEAVAEEDESDEEEDDDSDDDSSDNEEEEEESDDDDDMDF